MYKDIPVSDQAAFNAAIAAGDYPVIETDGRYEIRDIPAGHVIRVKGTARPTLVAHDSSSPITVAYDSSSPRTEAYGSSSPITEAYGSSSPITVAYGSSSPRTVAYGSSSPRTEAYGSSSPITEAYGSSSPRTEAYDSSSPITEAHDYSSVLHTGRGTVTADEHVTVRVNGEVTATGGALTHRVPLTTNPEAVLDTLARVEAHPEEWDQGDWAYESPCGTRYCFGGHALLTVGARMDVSAKTVEVASLPESLRSRFVREHVAISAGARAVLGVDGPTADRLFHGSNSMDDLRELVGEICAEASFTIAQTDGGAATVDVEEPDGDPRPGTEHSDELFRDDAEPDPADND